MADVTIPNRPAGNELRSIDEVLDNFDAILEYINDGHVARSDVLLAKGSIFAATAAGVVAQLAVGATNGLVLGVDSSTATGLKWIEGNLKTFLIQSDSAAVQNLTTGFVTMKQADNATDSSVTPESGKKYEVFVSWAAEKTGGTANPTCDFEVRNAAGTVLGRSMTPGLTGTDVANSPGGGFGGGVIRIAGANNPHRALTRCGVFTSDGTAVKLLVKASTTTDVPRLLRGDTYALLSEVKSS